jgi:hypothetical protein
MCASPNHFICSKNINSDLESPQRSVALVDSESKRLDPRKLILSALNIDSEEPEKNERLSVNFAQVNQRAKSFSPKKIITKRSEQ